ncbi:MAG: DUF2333 family protein [Desulfobacca sp.]|uniref:DUF2333 family protein n=1 Tax=Desulfobacca sp. TaxID=2067990 RepID=UPI00404B9BEE
MSLAPNDHEEPTTPAPPPAEPSGAPVRPSWQRYRLLILCALILTFFVYIFAARKPLGVELTTAPGEIAEKNAQVESGPVRGILRLDKEETKPAPPAPEPSFAPSARPARETPSAPPESSPAEDGQATAGAEKAPTPIPPPTPVPPAAEKLTVRPQPVKGEAFTRALIKIMDDQVNRRFFGWRPNTIVFGKLGLTDDVNNLQLGVLEVARRTVVVLNENMSRFALTEAQNPYVNTAMNFFMVSPEKYWFPSASGKYKEAMANLEQYIDDLKHNRSRFYTRVDNLIALMNHFRDVLGSAFHNLIKDTEADGSPVSWFVCDDYFYFAQGVATGMGAILEGVKEDFADQLAKKNSSKLVDDAIHALHSAEHLHPWLITNASKDGILANHRANMATYIGEAEHIISTLINVLATN